MWCSLSAVWWMQVCVIRCRCRQHDVPTFRFCCRRGHCTSVVTAPIVIPSSYCTDSATSCLNCRGQEDAQPQGAAAAAIGRTKDAG